MVVPQDLFCFFNFDGDQVKDYYGNYSGINSGAVFSTDTPSGEGKSVDFDGNSFILVQDNITPSGTAFSISFWFKTERNEQYIIGGMYIDGNLFQTETSPNSRWTWGSNVNATYFGVNNNVKFFNGKFDNFRSYNRALTAQEVQMLYNAKQ